jgi:soluble lytic murein transglycosylase-like protein
VKATNVVPCLTLVALLVGRGAEPADRAPRAQRDVAVRPVPTERLEVGLLDLASVRRVFHDMDRRRETLTEGELVGAWTDVSMVLAAVTGDPSGPPMSFEEVRRAAAQAAPIAVRATPGVAQRDAAADRLLALGYSARETADVLSRRISQRALDTARRMIAVGRERQTAADYLDTQYTLALGLFVTPRPHEGEAGGGLVAGVFDALIDRYAAVHLVEAAIVRAIIATESDFNPVARSRAGAIGLMQLMPGTARELGVNPLVPEQNIEGGVRYFAQMLKLFGQVELALVAYNAGPGFAERYARGRTGLYGETRAYVARVLARLKDPRRGPVR